VEREYGLEFRIVGNKYEGNVTNDVVSRSNSESIVLLSTKQYEISLNERYAGRI
jgi:hypothetical protein